MKISSNHVVTTILGLMVLGLAAALLLQDGDPVAPTPAPAPTPAAKPAPVVVENSALERALRKRIKALEAEVAELRAAQPPATNPIPPEAVRPVPKQSDFRPPSPREMMENMKRDDPKKYAEMKKWGERMRQRRLARTQGKIDFLASVETGNMTKEELANHTRYQELLAQRESQQIDPEQMSDEEMRAAMDERRNLEREIHKAARTERETLLKETASALGFSGDDAKELTATLNEIYEATRGDQSGPHGPPPGGTPPR